jgi:hypothetical protein
MEIEIDNYPVADLPSRFDLGKQAVYNRLEALGIKPTKVGKRSYISATQLQTLDRIHAHINQGGSIADFQSPDLEISPLDTMDKSTGRLTSAENNQETSPLDTMDKSTGIVENNLEVLVNLIAGAVSQTIASTVQQRSPLWYMSELERAEAQGWMLTTAEIQQLIGVKPTAATGTSTYQRGSFTFTKAGKIGSQTAWRVTKHLD